MPNLSESSSIKLGSTNVSKIYHGSTQVWPATTQTELPLNLYRFPQQIDEYTQYPELAKISNFPQALWLGDWMPSPENIINGHKQNSGTKTLSLVVYAIPFRDNGNYSSGGFQTDQEYRDFINKIANAIGDTNCIITLEPDALGLAGELDATAQNRRYNLIGGAVTRLKQCPNLRLYIDMGLWVEPADAATRLQKSNVANADGVAVNTSGFETTTYCFNRGDSYVDSLAALGIANKTYTIDTSRNGDGPLTSAYPNSQPWIDSNQPWANPPGRALGYTPRLATEFNRPKCYALLWIKNAGESDATFPRADQNAIFNTDAPIPGTVWIEWARHTCNNTP